MSSTRARPDVIIVFTALHPAPPPPITLMRTGDRQSSWNENIRTPPLARGSGRAPVKLEELEHPRLHSIQHSANRSPASESDRGDLLGVTPCIQQQSHSRGMHGIAHDVSESADAAGRPPPGGKVEYVLSRVRHA